MKVYPQRIVAPLAAALLLASALAARPAQAMSLYFDGPGGFGVSQEQANALELTIIREVPIERGLGRIAIDVQPDQVPAVPPAGTLADPALIASTWNIDVIGEESLFNAYVVFRMPQSGSPYTPDHIGFEIDPSWVLFEDFSSELPRLVPGVPVGDLLSDGIVGDLDFALPLVHAIGEAVQASGQNPIVIELPGYVVRLVFGQGQVPEPSGLGAAVLALGIWRLARARRRSD